MKFPYARMNDQTNFKMIMSSSNIDLASAIIVDVRSDYEYNLGHIPDSINIPLDEIENRIDEFKDLEGEIVICCQSGAVSSNAAELLKEKGLDNVHDGGGWSILNLQVINAR